MGYMKSLVIAAQEKLVEEYMEDHPDANEDIAFENFEDLAYERAREMLADRIDYARMMAKEKFE
jgi:hypothetical protein